MRRIQASPSRQLAAPLAVQEKDKPPNNQPYEKADQVCAQPA
jgi:hypothetical protein